jgi:hypothetical protein
VPGCTHWKGASHPRVLPAGLAVLRPLRRPVRGCPWDRRRGSPGARTYSGQRAWRKRHLASFAQVRCDMEVQAGAVCKTVGSAYVGSNPTPATTCEDGPLAGDSRLCGPFFLCPVVCRLVSLRGAVSRCPRTYSGRDPCPRTVGAHHRCFHGRPRTGRVGAVFCGLAGADGGDGGQARAGWRPWYPGPLRGCVRPPAGNPGSGLDTTSGAGRAADSGDAYSAGSATLCRFR